MAQSKRTAWQGTVRSGSSPVGMGFARIASMFVVATIVIYALMYLSVLDRAHVEFSQMRLWRALIMGCVITLVMLCFTWSHWKSNRTRTVIIALVLVTTVPALWLLRSQRTVGDLAYLKSMIPNHSVAVLASERARLHDDRVRMLAEQIAHRQLKEIREMQDLILELEHPQGPPPTGTAATPDRPRASAGASTIL
ncbi:MAG: DUF305 domain-containing protein [Pseudomonadota bacterium]